MKSGLPPAAAAILARSSSATAVPIRLAASSLLSGSSRTAHWPGGAALEQLRAGDADEQQRGAAGEQHDMLDQVEERLLAPLNVVEDKDERGLLLEQLAERPGDLLRRRPRLRLPQERADRRRGGRIRGRRVELLQHLHDRPVGDPRPVGQAAAADDRRLDHRQRLGRQPRLAQTRVGDDRDQLAAPLRQRPRPGLAQQRQLALAADEDRLVPALGRRVGSEQPVGGQRLALPLQHAAARAAPPRPPRRRARASPLRSAPPPAEPPAASGRPRSARHRSPAAPPSPSPPHPSRARSAPRSPAPGTPPASPPPPGRPASASSSCTAGTPNTAITASPMNFSTEPPCSSTTALHPLEIAGQQRPQRLRIRRLPQRRRTDQITEQHRHHLAALARATSERRGTRFAEPGGVAVLVAAARADQHGRRLDRIPPRQRPPRLAEALPRDQVA